MSDFKQKRSRITPTTSNNKQQQATTSNNKQQQATTSNNKQQQATTRHRPLRSRHRPYHQVR
jgi:hypothetical protein